MTQPPNQPPQGGFGPPPQDPSQGPGQTPPPGQPPQMPPAPPSAPGTPPPAAPPAQPGYGYPQQPPAAGGPGQQSGYGFPQQQPQQPAGANPYSQPGQPGQYGQQPQQPGTFGQPQYGYPTQPQYPSAPGGGQGGGRSPFKGKPAVIIGAVVAVLLVAGGVVWAVTGGDDDEKKPEADGSKKPSASGPVNPGDGSGDGGKQSDDPEDFNADRQPGEAKVLWYKSAPDAPGNGAEAPGQWITGDVAAKAAYKQIFGYKVADGAPAWEPISFEQEICAVSQQSTSDGKIVAAYKDGVKDGAKCNQLVEVDLKTGKKGWTKKLGEGELFDSTLTVELYISKDTLIVGRSQSGVGMRMSDGKQIWSKKEEQDGVCFPDGFTGGDRVIVTLGCAAGKDTEHDKVEEIDAATGKTKWSKDLPKGWEAERVYSTNPVVLYSTNEDKKQWNISTLKNGSGQTRSQVDVDESFAPSCGMAILQSDLQGCQGTAADANTLYLPTDAKSGANEIVAINLSTGKESWRVKAPGDASMLPMKVEGGSLIAYQQPTYDGGGVVLSIPTSGDHKPTTLLKNPEATADIENGFYSKAFDYVDGRFYISTTRLSGDDDTQEKLMLAFGK